jgi:D-alanyl-D-alanine dipeptidase
MENLPEDFVYLRAIDPTIVQSVRYASESNFMGAPVNGYQSSEIILTKQAAEALKAVQEALKAYNYCLVVYDGYRPQTAVDQFILWSQDDDISQKELYYPTIEKLDLFKGYIAKKSGHTRGSTVDLTIIELGKSLHPIEEKDITLANGEGIKFLDDGSVDMGSSFDILHPVSHHDTDLIPQECLDKRNFLRKTMEENGFKAYSKEWWHYTLIDEPYPETYFDFPITAYEL